MKVGSMACLLLSITVHCDLNIQVAGEYREVVVCLGIQDGLLILYMILTLQQPFLHLPLIADSTLFGQTYRGVIGYLSVV